MMYNYIGDVMIEKGMKIILEDGFEYVVKDFFTYNGRKYYYFERTDEPSVVFGYFDSEIVIVNDYLEVRELIAFYVKNLKLV